MSSQSKSCSYDPRSNEYSVGIYSWDPSIHGRYVRFITWTRQAPTQSASCHCHVTSWEGKCKSDRLKHYSRQLAVSEKSTPSNLPVGVPKTPHYTDICSKNCSLAANCGDVTILGLRGLSAAFGTVDNGNLIDRLFAAFDICGSVIARINSFMRYDVYAHSCDHPERDVAVYYSLVGILHCHGAACWGQYSSCSTVQ